MPAAIRPATHDDIDALTAIENRVFPGDRLSRRSFARLVRAASAMVLVAEAGSEVAGYALVLLRAGSTVARLYSIASLRPGAGSALLAAAEEAARRRGCERLRLEVRDDNARAIELYRLAGFRGAGEVPDYYEDGATALRFEKSLDRPSAKPSSANRLAAARMR